MQTLLLANRLGRWLAVLLLGLLALGSAQAQTLVNETFEGTNSFTVVNGTQVNKWFVGTVAGNGLTTAGTQAAYVSDDAAGATYNYGGALSVVHMYRDVVIPAGQTINQLSFDWKGQGESTYDYLQVFVVPTSTTPVAGTQLTSGQVGNTYYNLQGTTYTRATINLPASVAGTTQRLVFSWRNDASVYNQPPTALDNVTLTSAAPVPVCGTKTVGPTAGADYPTLTAALAAVNTNGVCGPLLLELQPAYVSTTETFPLVYSNTAGTSATNTVTIRPMAGATGLSITSTVAGAVFNIVGGRYLVLDGRPGGSGSTVSGAATATDLLVASTSTSGIPLQFTSDATFNTVQHCQVKGVGTSDFSYPDVNFTGTVATTGNSDNTVQNCNIGDGATTPVTLIYGGNTLNARNTISNNNLFNFYNASGASYGIEVSQAGNGWVIAGNSLYQTATRGTVSFTHYGIYVVSGNGHTISNNSIGGSTANAGGTPWTASGTTGAYRFAGIFLTTPAGAATSVQGNNIGNFTWVSTSGATTTYGVWSGIYVSSGDANIGTVAGNTIGTTAGPVSVTISTAGGYSFGISTASSGTVNIVGNTVGNLTGVGSTATIASNVAGILASAGTANTISRNKLYALVSGSGGANLSTGIWLLGGTTNHVNNNLIGDLRAATSTSLAAVSGILVAGGTTNNVAFNTVRLDGTSTGATFGTQGIYLNSLTAGLNLFDNIVVNLSTPVGAGGVATAIRRISGTAGTVPSNLFGNNNLYYAGTPSATNLIYTEGTATQTNAIQTLAAYKAFLLNREANSVTETATPFASTTGSSPAFLHLTPGAATQAESGGQSFGGITTDYDGDVRNTSTPDIGADEGAFLLTDVTGPVITITALTGSAGSTTSRTLTATITDPSGVASGANAPRLYFRKGTSGAFTASAAPTVAGSTYTFTFDYSLIGGVVGGDVINYYVAAQDALGNASTNPTGGNGATAPAVAYTYTVLLTLNGTYYVGTGASPDPARTYATLTAAAAAYSGNALGGPVTFLLLDNAYSAATNETFPVVFFNNADASATNTLLIKPNTGASPVITAAGSVLALASTRYVTIDGSNTAGGTTRNLTLANSSLTAGTYSLGLLSQTGQAQSNLFATVRNLNLTGGGATANATYGVLVSGADNDNLTLQNNSIQGVTLGVQAFGSANVSTGGLDNLVITGNVVGPPTATTGANINQYGILVASAISPLITGNEVQNIVNPTAAFASNMTGVLLQDVKGGIVSRNSVHNLTYTGTSTAKLYGISTQISTSTFNTAGNAGVNRFDNNLVYNLNSTAVSGSWNTSGINNNGGYGDQYYYNTVYLTGQLSNGTAGSAAFSNGNGISSVAATNIDVRNNIFSIIGGTGSAATTPAYAHYTTLTSYAGSTLNYNDLYVTVGTNGVARVGRINGADAVTLADWRTAAGQEANSVSADPLFLQTTTVPYNLTPSATAVNNVATPIAGVTVDFTGAPRSGTPDIGAYEFTPPSCQPVTGLTFTGITSTTASISFTAPTAGASNYTVTYTPTGGTATTVTPAPSGSPIALSGLAPRTVYIVTVITNCTGGSTSPTATGTFTTACAPPTYATLPAAETFESTWLSRCDVREVPTTNWLNTPATGNPSWRRDDDGAAANWTSPTFGAYTPAGSRGSAHSARFHSYYAANGAVGTLDYYVDLSPTGTKRLTFDFGNVSTAGSKLEMLLSTDGGATFSPTPLLTLTTAATFAAQTLDLTATSATSVIRFKATSDFGSYDIGVDNVLVRVLPAVDLAATALATPVGTQSCYSNAETVSVTVTNQGSAALNFTTNPATVTAVVTTPGGSQTLNGSITTGTLAAGASQTVTLVPTLDMSALGTYTFAITATVTGDGNTTNDLLTPSPTRTVTAPVAGTLVPAATAICNSGTATLTLTGAANGSIQFQNSTSATGTFTNIGGATSATYTTPVLTTTTYYRAQVTCGTNVATSNVSTITVNTPVVASTNTPVAICSGTTATLTATPSAGASVRFFSAATGGTALTTTTAGSYTTPALTASTTYYAEAFTGGTETVGKTTSIQTDGGYSGGNTGIVFTAAGPVTIQTATVYNATATAGSVSVELRDNATGTLIATAGPLAVTAGSATSLIPTVLPLNLTVPAAGTYRLVTAATPTPPTLYRDFSSGNTYPFTSPSGVVSVTGGYISGASTTYYFFFNLAISTQCVGAAARTAIQVNVTQPATVSFPTATAATCGATPYQLAGTVTGSATTGTYTSSGSGTFSPNATTLNATYTPSAADITAGTVTITLTSGPTGPCAAATATLALSISPAPVATFSYPAATYCAGSTSTVSPTLGSGAAAGTFSSTTGLSLNPASGVIDLSASTAGTYTVTNTIAASGPCATTTASTQVTITPQTTAGFSYPVGPYCTSGTTNPAPTVTGTAGGSFASTPGLSLNAASGAIALAASTPGTYTVSYTVAGPCGSAATQTVTISAAPLAAFSYPTATYCAGSTSTATPTLGGGSSAGTFSSTTGLSLNASTGVIDLSTSTAGTYTVTNTIAAANGCGAVTATSTVTITPQTSAAFAYAGGTFCQSGANPTPTITGTAGGTFTVSPATGLSVNATTGTITLATSTLGTYTVSYTVAGPCGSAATQTVTISAAPLAAFSYPAATTYCAGAASTVTPTLGGGSSAGTFSSTTGLSLNASTGVIDLSASTAGTYTVTNTIAASGSCAAATATASVTVTPATSAAFSYGALSFCVSGPTAPVATVTGTSGGTFTSTTGLTLNATTGAITLASSMPGTYTVTYTVTGPCGSSATASVTINAAPVATFSYGTTSTYCVSGTTNPAVTLGTGATAGTFSASPTGLSLNASTGVIDLSTSTPGTYTVTNTIAAANGCAATLATSTVTITVAPVASFSYGSASAYCVSGTTNPAVTLGLGATAGTFSSTTGLTLNATTGAITLASSTPGTYTVTNTVAAANGCASATATSSVTITAAPVASFGYGTVSSFCVSGTTNPSVALGTGATAGTFTSTTGLTLSATTGAITLASSTPGTYTVTNTVAAANGCAATTATATVTITAAPVASFGYPTATTYCAGSASTVTPTLGTGAAAGTFASATGLSLNAATGVISLATSTAGTYTVTNTIAAANGCAPAVATTTVTITPATTATFSYAGATFCRTTTTAVAPAVTGTSGGTFASTTGLTINATTGAITPSTSTAGTYVVTYTVAGPCGSSSTQTVVVTNAPVAAFTYPTTVICAGQTATVAPTLGAGATAGTFSSTTGLTINATTGIISPSTSTAGTYTVTNLIAAANGCAVVSSAQSVTILPVAVATFSYGTPSTFCVSGTTNPSVTLGTGATAGTFSSTTGLTLNATTGAITLASSTPGTYTVTNTVAASGAACGNAATTTVTITAAPLASFSYSTTAGCEGSTAAITPTLGAGATAGTFSSTTGLAINATTGAITLASSTPGTYTVTNTVAAANRCAAATATATFTVNPRPAAPVLSASYNGTTTTLTSSAATGNQFYLNGAAIAGATGTTYTVTGLPAQLGSYTVTTTNATTGCVSLPSNVLVVTAARTGIAGASLRLFPNPTSTGLVTLELTGFRLTTQLTVLDALGRVVSSAVLPANAGTAVHALDLSGAATGVYLLRLRNADGVQTQRLLRE